MTESTTRTVKFSFSLRLKTDKDYAALPGTAAWVKGILAHAATYVKVGVSKDGNPAVWLYYEQMLPGGAAGMKYTCLATYWRDWSNKIVVDYWPLEEASDPQKDFLCVNGINLTKGGEAVFRALGKKARTLLRASLRRGDGAAGPVKLKLSPA